MCIRISYHMRLGLVRYSYHTEYEVLPPRLCCTTFPGADNIRYTQYYFIMVALASNVHSRCRLVLIPNCATVCELSTL
jgi:hypothetical protein